MLAATADIPFGYLLCGIIWALVLGLAAGNYACSLVHRLPRGKPMLDKTPYCGSCGTLLGVKDLFPMISAIMLRHRCRYCGAPFPTSHTWTEALVALLFVLAFLQHNFSESYLLIVLIGTFLITLAAIEVNDHMIMGRILLCVLVPAMIYRALLDHNIFNFFMGGLYGLVLGAALTRKHIKPTGHVYALPPLAKLLVVGGVCAGGNNFLWFLVLFAAFYAISRAFGKIPVTVPFGLAVMVPVLYPDSFSLILP